MMFHYLNADGYNREIMEISTGQKNNPEIPVTINVKKDKTR